MGPDTPLSRRELSSRSLRRPFRQQKRQRKTKRRKSQTLTSCSAKRGGRNCTLRIRTFQVAKLPSSSLKNGKVYLISKKINTCKHTKTHHQNTRIHLLIWVIRYIYRLSQQMELHLLFLHSKLRKTIHNRS